MLRDRVEQTSTTSGTGTYSLTGTVANRQTFIGSGIASGGLVYYLAVDLVNGGWEIGIGTLTDLATDTLARTAIIASSNGGLAVNWAGGGTRNIMCVAPAELFGPMMGRLITGIAGGTANALTLTTLVPLRALERGAICIAEAIADNTGAATLNVSSTGAIAIRKDDGTVALEPGDIQDGGLYMFSYDQSANVWQMVNFQGVSASATRRGLALLVDAAAMEGKTAGRVVTADLQHRHPAHLKSVGRYNGITPAIIFDDGWTSLTDTGNGDQTVNFDAAFANTNHGFTCGSDLTTANTNSYQVVNWGTAAVGSQQIFTSSNTPNPADSEIVAANFFGDL